MGGQSTGGRTVVYSVRWYRMLVSVFFWAVLLPFLFAIPSAWATDRSGAAFVIVLAAAIAALAVRSLRVGTVRFSGGDVVIPGMFRTRRVALREVRSVGVTDGSSLMLNWRVPFFELQDGSVVRADEVRSLRSPSVVDAVVVEARERQRDERSADSTVRGQGG